jgi:hypothetical protein
MSIRERDCEPVRRGVRKPMHAVCQKITILPLFAIGDDQRACGFESFDSVSNCIFVKSGNGGVLAVDLAEFLDEIRRPRNAAHGLRRYGDQGRVSVVHVCTSHFAGQSETESTPMVVTSAGALPI